MLKPTLLKSVRIYLKKVFEDATYFNFHASRNIYILFSTPLMPYVFLPPVTGSFCTLPIQQERNTIIINKVSKDLRISTSILLLNPTFVDHYFLS